MNVENIRKVRDHIAALPPERFNMDRWAATQGGGFAVQPAKLLHDCKTCGCIGGWTRALFPRQHSAGEALGLSGSAIDRLFYPEGVGSYIAVTIPQAVAVLDHLLDIGEVDWSVADQVSA